MKSKKVTILPNEGYPLVRDAKIGRNAVCLCGSGMKNKKCCNSPTRYCLTGEASKARQAELERQKKESYKGIDHAD